MNSNTRTQQFVNFYFQVHQPNRLKKFNFFDIGSSSAYFDETLNREIITKVASRCYQPANEMLLRLIKKYPSIRITFSLSGIAMEQLKMYAPQALESFRQLAATGAVEFLGETYYHSLASLLNEKEFISQIEKHRKMIVTNFDCEPIIFRNTELIYSDSIGEIVSKLGFKGIYLDGIKKALLNRTPDSIYSHPEKDLFLFPRNYQLTDDIAFRYSDSSWNEWPLTATKFINWLSQGFKKDRIINLGMDYETFGEHQKSNSGIFKFMEDLICGLATKNKVAFINPSEALHLLKPSEIISAKNPISWADQERDLSAWLGNDMQRDAFNSLKKLLPLIREGADIHLLRLYRYLMTSDHFYYMSTKNGSDGNVHQYFSPYSSPYEAFMNYMNVLADLEYRLNRKLERMPLVELAFS